MERRVLILEDDPLVACVMASCLEDTFDCAASIAVSVAEAAPLLDTRLTCALLDVEVADGRSYPLATQLLHRNIPFIFVSGTTPDAVPPDLAAVPFLRKPVGMKEVLKAVQHYL